MLSTVDRDHFDKETASIATAIQAPPQVPDHVPDNLLGDPAEHDRARQTVRASHRRPKTIRTLDRPLLLTATARARLAVALLACGLAIAALIAPATSGRARANRPTEVIVPVRPPAASLSVLDRCRGSDPLAVFPDARCALR